MFRMAILSRGDGKKLKKTHYKMNIKLSDNLFILIKIIKIFYL